MILVTTKHYDKKSKKFFKSHPQLKQKYKSVVLHLVEDINHPSLKLHKLKGDLDGLWAASLDYQFRIILIVEFIQDRIVLVDIGSHDDVYGHYR